MSDERSKDELREENKRLRERLTELQEYVPQVNTKTTRRSFVGSVIGGVGLYALLGKASAQTSGSGQIASQANPALRAYIDRVHYVERSSDPSGPADGTAWYNSGA